MSDNHPRPGLTPAEGAGDGPVLPVAGERAQGRHAAKQARLAPPHRCVPDGPLDTDPGDLPVLPVTRGQALVAVLSGVPLGAFDLRVLGWLSGVDGPACMVLASVIWRARQAGVGEMRGEDQVDGDDLGDDDEVPFCTVCGENVSMFYGMSGWQHFRGNHAPGSHRELFEAAHDTEVAWRQVDPRVALAGLGEPDRERLRVADNTWRRYRVEEIRAFTSRTRQREVAGETHAETAALLAVAVNHLSDLAAIIDQAVTPK